MSYHLTYKFEAHEEAISREDVPDDHGACDAAFVYSIIHADDGSVSYQDWSVDGRTGESLGVDAYFKIWTILAGALAEKLPEGGRKQLCEETFERVRTAMLSSRTPIVPGTGDIS